MLTKVRTRLARRFELWDVDGNGRVDRADFDLEAHRIVDAFDEDDSSPRGRAVIDAYLAMWDYLATKAKVGPNGSLSATQFERVAQLEIIEPGNVGFSGVLRPTVSAALDLCDTDGDGQISPNEFKRWIDAIGVDQSEADAAFRQIDVNGDGQLSVEELIQAVREYYAGTLDIPLLGR